MAIAKLFTLFTAHLSGYDDTSTACMGGTTTDMVTKSSLPKA
jgi:hypothetical protein